MKSYQTNIKKCTEEYFYLDKKMRERKYRVDKSIIVLDEKSPFRNGDEVRIICEEDFQKLFQAIKKLKTDNNELMGKIDDLKFKISSNNEIKDINNQNFIKKFLVKLLS